VFLSHAKPRSRDEDKGKEDGGMSCRFAAIHAAASSRNGHKGAILTVPIAVDCRRLPSIAVDCRRLPVDCRRLPSIAKKPHRFQACPRTGCYQWVTGYRAK